MLALLHDQQVALHILSDHKPALARSVVPPADAEAAALAERIVHQPVVTADVFSLLVDHVSRLCRKILHQKLLEIALADKANAGAVLLFRVGQPVLSCSFF